ncbi:hypothetical protein [Nonomuraea roseoviolacea]|uniref:hypothetical protein n=1 Tax=Nonomuraea roseoviolacea TaxID=103837 RepID=UPI0031DBC263
MDGRDHDNADDVVIIGAGPVGENVADAPAGPACRRRHRGSARGVTGGLDAASVLDRRDSRASQGRDDDQVGRLDPAGITVVRAGPCPPAWSR